MKLLHAIFFSILFVTPLFSQEYEFVGILKFSTASMVSYRMVFTENNGRLKGYSITDMQGENETKNRIEGTYDKKTKMLVFEEKEIDYTKSKVDKGDFCYVHFKGKLALTGKSTLKGDFNGLFKNKTKCVNGSLHLTASGNAYERMNKFTKKIKKSKSVDAQTKEKVDLNKMLDSLKLNVLRTDEVTSVFFKGDDITMTLWDAGKEDGDRISVFVDDKPILVDYEIKNIKKNFKLHLNSNTAIVKIVALNTGTIAPNTAKIALSTVDKEIELSTVLDKNNTTIIRIEKRNQD